MQMRLMTLMMLSILCLAGCGSGTTVITNPKDLPPLTEKEKQEIRSEDARVQEEEGGAYLEVQRRKVKKTAK